MALQNKTKSINLTATSVVSGSNVANRSEMMQDQMDFEVEAYALLDSMRKTNEVASDETIYRNAYLAH